MNPDTIVQSYTPDKQRLAELVILSRGSRTNAQYADVLGISAPTLSRISNGKITQPVNLDLLEKIYATRADDADFSFDTLLAANGMVDKKTLERGKEYVERMISQKDQGIALERHAKNAIVNALMDRGITVQSIHPDFDNRRYESPFGISLPYDFNLYVPGEHSQYWYFTVVNGAKRLPAGLGNTFARAARLFVLDAWSPEFLVRQKTSFVFDHELTYQLFVRQYKDAPIKSAVSAILIDATTETVIEETWMSSTPEEPSIFTRPVTGSGEIAVWVDEDFDDQM